MKKLILAATLFSALAAGAAYAEDESTKCDVPKDKWMSEDAMKAKAKEMGLEVRKIKIENGCYEVYAIDAKGKKVEQIFNPETGVQVGTEGSN
ncbi:PepSY domain-containing protein [Rhizobium sp. C4]|uniref:PepSY domain-containing protein n=1 Tax=Rhizobium sp. C4 TaxID=1349800 RepID=UPI001E3E8590|nr:PepSY domain-containing protein [Rhizobium sp. C4]MCD2174582.1 PepSY domain-containing protein [Rhizobium sp. C4]